MTMRSQVAAHVAMRSPRGEMRINMNPQLGNLKGKLSAGGSMLVLNNKL